jgi:hypothetical protein
MLYCAGNLLIVDPFEVLPFQQSGRRYRAATRTSHLRAGSLRIDEMMR